MAQEEFRCHGRTTGTVRFSAWASWHHSTIGLGVTTGVLLARRRQLRLDEVADGFLAS
jgi:hypothetical protein